MRTFLTACISFYQRTISPDHGAAGRLFLPAAVRCRFYPSCSEYAKQAVARYGVVRGVVRGARRVLRCGPHNPGGVDLP